MQLVDADGKDVPGALYAKVVGADPGSTDGFSIRFTSSSPEIEAFLRKLLSQSPTTAENVSGAMPSKASSAEAAGTDRGDMAVIGAAAASDQLQVGQRRQELRVFVREPGNIADIDLRGCIELGVTLGRRVGPQSADAADPGRSALAARGRSDADARS